MDGTLEKTEWGRVFVGRDEPALFQSDPNIEMGVDPVAEDTN